MAFVVLLLFVAGCQSLQLQQARDTAPSDWPTEGDSPGRTHAVDVVLDPPLAEAWAYNAGAGFGPASPLIVGGAVIVANRKGEVHGIDLDTGRKLGLNEFGESIEGSPVVGGGLLYVPVSWGGRAVQAYDLARGTTRWRARTAPVEAGLLLTEHVVVAADVEGYVRAYARDEGTRVWEHHLGEGRGVQATPAAAGPDRVVVADDAGRVVALDVATGGVLWRRELGAPVIATPAAGDEAVYVAAARGRLVALDAATGVERWAYEVPDTSVYLASPALSGGELVLGGSDGLLRSLDAATGAERWVRQVYGAITAPPLLTQRSVFVGTMHNRLLAVDRATGEVRWTHELDGRVKSPMAFKNGALVVLAEPRTVYLFKHAPPDYASSN